MATRIYFSESKSKRKESGYGGLFAIMVIGMLLLGLLLYGVKTNAQTITLTYNQSFTGGVTATTQCDAWQSYRTTLLGGYTYSGFNISGSMDPVGITCTNSYVAKQIAYSLRTGTNIFGITSDGHNWFVQNACGPSTSVELGGDVPGGGCSCSPSGYSVRPCFGTPNWGGIDGPNCGAASQTMIVKFFVQPVTFVNGPSQSLTLCENATKSISSLLAITDGVGDTETWTIASAPVHGIIGGLSATAPSDTDISPAGVTYTPTPGYIGTDVFSVQVNNGFQTATTTVTVNVAAAPTNITGASTVCTGTTTTLTETTTGGTWSSSNTARAVVNTAGVVSGIMAGAVVISYTGAGGCATTFPMTVNQTPAGITGSSTVCSGSTLTLADATTGGAWSSSSIATASIAPSTGVVTGGTPGIATIVYTAADGCTASAIITVNVTPAAITGPSAVCTATTISLTETTTGGTWASSNATLGSVNTSGAVSGIAPGPITITYALPTGCSASHSVTVNQTPANIAGPVTVCTGQTITLTDANAGGTWSSSNTADAPVGSSTGIVTGSGPGSAIITYTLPGGCTASDAVTVNPTPANITGPATVCTGTTISLLETTSGGTWSSSNTSLATVDMSGIVSGVAAGAVTITYTLPAGCAITHAVTVDQTPAAIAGPGNVCIGLAISLTDANAGGTWASSNTTDAPVGTSTGVVTGVAPGTATITYTLAGGCNVSTTVTVSTSLPSIEGLSAICVGNSSTLTDAVAGGVWNSDMPATVNVDASSGVISGLSTGVATITYTSGACSATKTITADPMPAPITGGTAVCQLSSITLSDASPSGTWSSSAPGIAIISPTSGVLTGASAGPATITYSLGVGCIVTAPVVVQPAPAAIAGPAHVCVGVTAAFTDATSGGSWYSSNPAIAPISGTGVATGVSGGLDTVIYTLSTGCSATRLFPVIAVPAITGLRPMCAWTDTLIANDSNTTGIFTSSLVTVNNLGGGDAKVYGHAVGLGIVTYTVPAGCYTMATFTVNTLPALIGGTFNVCTGLATTLTDTSGGGVWNSSTPSVATIDSFSGLLSGISGGTSEITYTLPTGCRIDTSISVSLPPSAIAGTANVCVGGVALLSDLVGGGAWSSSNPAIASVSGGLVSGLAAGIATITYSEGAGCNVTTMVTINPAPVAYDVVGGGSYCAGGAGEYVLVNGSETGVSYQLYNGIAPVGAPLAGTGGIIDFGLETGAGTYSVTGTALSSTCMSAMTGSAVIIVNPSPEVFTVTGSGAYCAGSGGNDISLSGSQAGINYQLSLGALILTGPTAGTGGAIDFGTHTTGVYTVEATNPITSCSSLMADSAVVTVSSVVTPAVSVAASLGAAICPGTPETFTASAINGGTLPAYQWKVNGINTGTGLPSYTYNPANGDIVSVLLTSSVACAIPDTVSNAVSVAVLTGLTPVVSVSATPGTVVAPGESVTFTASVTGGGTSLTYQWNVNGAAVPGATSATFISSTLPDGAVVSCVVTGTSSCGTQTGEGQVTMTVNGSSYVQTLTNGADIRVIPNPNNGTFVISGQLSSNANQDVTLSITDMLGQQVYKGSVTATGGKLNDRILLGNNIANGMYLLNVNAGAGNQVFHIVVAK